MVGDCENNNNQRSPRFCFPKILQQRKTWRDVFFLKACAVNYVIRGHGALDGMYFTATRSMSRWGNLCPTPPEINADRIRNQLESTTRDEVQSIFCCCTVWKQIILEMWLGWWSACELDRHIREVLSCQMSGIKITYKKKVSRWLLRITLYCYVYLSCSINKIKSTAMIEVVRLWLVISTSTSHGWSWPCDPALDPTV